MADWVNIVLTSTGQAFRLPREFILTQMPQSLFASALELDPTATTIDVDNPIITPTVMQFLVNYSQGIEPEEALPELEAAERYLNVPWMHYYADPGYDQIMNRANPNSEENREGIEQNIIDGDHYWAYAYLLSKGYDPLYSDLQLANYLHSQKILQLIQERKQFTPQPDLLALAGLMFDHIKNFIPTTDDLEHDPRETKSSILGSVEDIRDLLGITEMIAKGLLKGAYDYMRKLDTNIRERIPKTIWAVFTIMFEKPETVWDYDGDWTAAHAIPWLPALPDKPSNLFGNW
jgi:hypothetical protein